MKYAPETAICECEHVRHSRDDPQSDLSVHEYGHEIPLDDARALPTEFGLYIVCSLCARTCMKNYT